MPHYTHPDPFSDVDRDRYRRMDGYRLRECISWAERNGQGESEETRFARHVASTRKD